MTSFQVHFFLGKERCFPAGFIASGDILVNIFLNDPTL